MTQPDILSATPSLPLDQDGGPVFEAPWQARVFAMTLQAHEAGVFTWPEWAETLGAELAADTATGSNTRGYYDHWLCAFEKLLTQKSVAADGRLASLREAWDKAARATPHGQPILLKDT